jgi:hypothetical protein
MYDKEEFFLFLHPYYVRVCASTRLKVTVLMKQDVRKELILFYSLTLEQ